MLLKFLAAVAVVATCGMAQAQEVPAPHAGGPKTVAFVTNNPSDYWTIVRKGCEKAAQELPGVTLQFVMPADGTVATQKQDVDDLLTKGIKGIAISPVDPASETTDLNTWTAKVPLITSDSDAPASHRLCYIGTDDVAAGRMAGQLMKQALPRGGQILLFVGLRDARNARDRIQGIQEALNGSNIHILGVRTDNTDHARALAAASEALVKYPHLAGMIGLWSYNGPAILSAVRNAHKVGQVKIVAFDEEQGTLDGVQSGAIYAAVAQDAYTFGYKSVQMLARLAGGDRSALPLSQKIIVPALTLRRGNVAAYEAQRARRLARD